MIVVIDASVAVKWYLPEADVDIAERFLSDEYELHAPELILSEFGNILWKKSRTGEIETNIVRASVANFKALPITLHSHKELIEPAVAGAVATGQTVYDWVYLALAVSMSVKFVTADRRFFYALKNTDLEDRIICIPDVE